MPIPIKRYQNRKLYNTITKRYITLEEVGELIRGGNEILVTDSPSGDDISTHILTQVIMRQEKKGERILSQGLLTGLIRAQFETITAVKLFLHSPTGWEGLLNNLGIPTREDVNQLTEELEILSQAIEEISLDNDKSGRK